MAYTSTDLDNVEAAILDLALGKRKTRATIGGTTFEFAQVDMDKLEALKARINAGLGNVTLRTYAKQGRRSR